jgi:hypothetical protein
MIVRVPQLVLVATMTASTLACAKAHARVEPALPVLSPPPPPPRLVETYVDEPVPTVEPSPVESALATPPPRPAPRPPAPRQEAPKPEPVRTEPERPAVAPPALTLKPTAGTEAKTEASIRMLLGDASRNLARVNYPALDVDGRTAYDIARRFMQQSEEALKTGNLAFAEKLASKAVTMAEVLIR